MRVIISGGSGLIGTGLAKELIRRGYQVVILSRNPQKVVDVPEEVIVARWDGKTSLGWGHYVDGANAIVNLAGENIAGEKFFPTRWTEARKEALLMSRLVPGKALVAAIRHAKNKPNVFIQSSAIGYYGTLADEIIDETHPAGDDFLAKVCVAWENSTHEIEDLGVRRVVIRTGVVFSPFGGAFDRLVLPFRFFAGGPLGNGKQFLSWIHLADQVNAICFLIDNRSAQGIYNLTAPEPITNAELARTIGRIAHRPAIVPIPGFLFRLMFGEVATVVLDGQRVIPSRLMQQGFTYKFSSVEAAVTDLLRLRVNN